MDNKPYAEKYCDAQEVNALCAQRDGHDTFHKLCAIGVIVQKLCTFSRLRLRGLGRMLRRGCRRAGFAATGGARVARRRPTPRRRRLLLV